MGIVNNVVSGTVKMALCQVSGIWCLSNQSYIFIITNTTTKYSAEVVSGGVCGKTGLLHLNSSPLINL